MQPLLWIVGCAGAVLAVAAASWALRRRASRKDALPAEWALTPRPVFSTDERRVYRLLREALPHHIVLSKLPLVRFCQPTDPKQVRYWYQLLGTAHVTFAVCSTNGRVLAAIDLDVERGNSRRVSQIKQSVLGACRVRYLRCPVDNLPSIADLQLLVPAVSPSSRSQATGSAQARGLSEASESLSSTVATRRAERGARWHDPSRFQDSFFAPDNRLDTFGSGDSEFSPSPTVLRAATQAHRFERADGEAAPPQRPDADEDSLGGVVVETLEPAVLTRH